MEDENGIELSLALSCGGSSALSKGKHGSSSDNRTDKGDRGNELIDDFKNFLHGATQKQDSVMGSSDPVKTKVNFFNKIDAPTNLTSGGFWVANDMRSTEVEEEKRPEAGNKRKNLFDEINHQKKREGEAHHADLHDKTRTSHISITTDECSTAENEEVADSEAEGPTSRLVQHHDDGSKRYTMFGSLPEVPKEVHRISDSSGVDLQGQKRFTISSEREFKLGCMPFGVPFPAQSVNIMNMPYRLPMKESIHPVGAPITSSYSLPGMMQVMAAANGESSGTQPVIPANLPLMFGYSPVQLPMLDKDNSCGLVSHSQQLQPSYICRGPPNSDKQNDELQIAQAVVPVMHKSFEATQYDGRALERAKGDGKQHPMKEGSSSQTEDDGKGSTVIVRTKDASGQAREDGFPSEFQVIRSGMASDLQFGGCGSYPNLPWVSTTAPGPKGRTISGVTYKYSASQIRIVCACHGSHMSPEEFVKHAGVEQTNPDPGSGSTFPSGNPPASAQS